MKTPLRANRFIAIRPGSQELLERPATWQDAVARLQYYSLGQILDVIGRINAVLSHGNVTDKVLQRQLCFQLLAHRAPNVWTNALKTAEVGTPNEKDFALFEELALLNLAKLACLTLPVDNAWHDESLAYMAIAGFMLNTLVDADWSHFSHSDRVSTSAGFRKNLYYVTTRLLANRRPKIVHEMARYYDLFCTEKPHLANHPSYLNLPRIIEEHVGLSLNMLFNCSFGLISHFVDIKASNFHEKCARIDREIFFDQFALSRADLDKFFATVSADAATICEHIRTKYSINNLRVHSVLPFAQAPLINIGSASVCPSPQHLLAKLTEGLYHLALNSLPSDKRSGFFIYTGRVFEDYVDRLLQRLYPKSSGPLYISSETIDDAVSSLNPRPPICDAIVVSGNSVVLIEIKAKLFNEPMRAGDDEDGFFKRLDEIYLEAAQQLSSTVDLIRAGHFADIGLTNHHNLKLYPVVVTLQPFVMVPPLYKFMTQSIRDAKLLQQRGVYPFQLIDIAELEIIETLVTNKGESLHSLLAKKISDQTSREHAFFNYYVSQGKLHFQDIANPHLSSQYLKLVEGVEGYFKSKLTSE